MSRVPNPAGSGRVVSQYLSGTQTRRIKALVDQYPEPLCEMHPRLAERLGVTDGDLVTVTSRRGDITLPANVVNTIRPDTVFIPYHWPGRKSANQLTISAQDPISKIPEYKVCAASVERLDADDDTTGEGPQVNFTPASTPKMFPYAQGEGQAPQEEEGKRY